MARKTPLPVLIWLPEDLRPSPGTFEGWLSGGLDVHRTVHTRLVEAIAIAIANEASHKLDKRLPWIKVGTGAGAAMFGIHEIRAVHQAPLKPQV